MVVSTARDYLPRKFLCTGRKRAVGDDFPPVGSRNLCVGHIISLIPLAPWQKSSRGKWWLHGSDFFDAGSVS